MQNDLISRSALLQKFNDTGIQITIDIPVEEILGEDVDIDDFSMLLQDVIQAYKNMVIDTIKNQPTAYDVEKVVAELEEWTFNADVNIGDGTIMNHDLIAGKIALDIVKRGGVNNCDVCEWIYNDEYDFAKSECGAIDTMRIAFRKWKYCPYCGKKIKVVG